VNGNFTWYSRANVSLQLDGTGSTGTTIHRRTREKERWTSMTEIYTRAFVLWLNVTKLMVCLRLNNKTWMIFRNYPWKDRICSTDTDDLDRIGPYCAYIKSRIIHAHILTGSYLRSIGGQAYKWCH